MAECAIMQGIWCDTCYLAVTVVHQERCFCS